MTPRLILSLWFLALCVPAALASLPAPAPEWRQVHRDDLVTVYRKEIPDSDVLAFRGTGTLDAPMAKLLSVILDVEHRAEWMQQVKAAEVLKQVSPLERVVYLHLSPPWPIKDREVVISEKIEIDRAAKRITMRLKSVEDASRPERPDRIRAIMHEGTFTLQPTADGLKTEMDAESHTDPKGSIPKWIVNLYQKSLPKKTLKSMLERVREPGIPDHALAKEL